jgi:hypothetical protein
MLNVRYVIFRGTPAVLFRGSGAADLRPAFSGPDYWVLTNPNVLPRAYVPGRVETVADDKERLEKMASRDFDPRRVAYVETSSKLPSDCKGTAEITGEIPTRVTLSLDMKTPGLVVLADRWDVGWNAYLDGRRVPILRTNHALRGVEVPAGKATLEFRYEPASFAWGVRLAAAALLATVGWLGAGFWFGGHWAPPFPPDAAGGRGEQAPSPGREASPGRQPGDGRHPPGRHRRRRR